VKANTTAAKTTAAEGRSYAERVLLTSTGVVLVARDSVTETVDGLVKRYGSVAGAQKELDKAQRTLTRDLKNYERRGVTARNRFEREVRRARTRLERELRQRRRLVEQVVTTNAKRVEREVKAFRGDVEKRASTVTDVVGGQIKATGDQVKALV
jgi:hypothetical protein